jgi:hypothetical protein
MERSECTYTVAVVGASSPRGEGPYLAVAFACIGRWHVVVRAVWLSSAILFLEPLFLVVCLGGSRGQLL